VGQISGTASPDGTVTENRYDAFGRLEETTWTVAGQHYAIEVKHDALGRVEELVYPDVPGRARFTVEHAYNAWGYLEEERDVSGPAPRSLWRVTARELDGALAESELGNGILDIRSHDPLTGRLGGVQTVGGAAVYSLEYHYDPNGNVESRIDAVTGRIETFDHDALDRLWRWWVNVAAGSRTTVYQFDDLNNLRRHWSTVRSRTTTPTGPTASRTR
jgi:YD repeat-containing protein